MKILVIGNCQARSLSKLLCDGVNTVAIEPIILHLAKAQDEPSHERLLSDADVILAQATSESFQPTHLNSGHLKARFGSRVIVWPNIFYLGQTPYLRYVTHTQQGRIRGPFGEYHDLRLLAAWFDDRFSRTLTQATLDPDAIAMRSIHDLRHKERLCDVIISDLIEQKRANQRLFFTFNHPTRFVLVEMSLRLLRRAGLRVNVSHRFDNEPLGRIRPPTSLNDLDAADDAEFQGLNLDAPGPPFPTKKYSSNALRRRSFQAYDAYESILSDFSAIRLTPSYSA